MHVPLICPVNIILCWRNNLKINLVQNINRYITKHFYNHIKCIYNITNGFDMLFNWKNRQFINFNGRTHIQWFSFIPFILLLFLLWFAIIFSNFTQNRNTLFVEICLNVWCICMFACLHTIHLLLIHFVDYNRGSSGDNNG